MEEPRIIVGSLVLKIVEARSLGVHSNINPYVNVRLVYNGTEDPLTKQRTSVARQTRDPVWNESMAFQLADFNLNHLYFRVWVCKLISASSYFEGQKKDSEQLTRGLCIDGTNSNCFHLTSQFTMLESKSAWSTEMWVDVDTGGQVRLVLDYTPKVEYCVLP